MDDFDDFVKFHARTESDEIRFGEWYTTPEGEKRVICHVPLTEEERACFTHFAKENGTTLDEELERAITEFISRHSV